MSQVAASSVDGLAVEDGREICLTEDLELQLPFLLPEDGYSCDIVKGVPSGELLLFLLLLLVVVSSSSCFFFFFFCR